MLERLKRFNWPLKSLNYCCARACKSKIKCAMYAQSY